MDRTFIQDRITATKAQIVAYETAVLALGNDNIQSYKLDTGQTIQTVTRADVKDMQSVIDSLYNRCATLDARLNGASSIGRPAW